MWVCECFSVLWCALRSRLLLVNIWDRAKHYLIGLRQWIVHGIGKLMCRQCTAMEYNRFYYRFTNPYLEPSQQSHGKRRGCNEQIESEEMTVKLLSRQSFEHTIDKCCISLELRERIESDDHFTIVNTVDKFGVCVCVCVWLFDVYLPKRQIERTSKQQHIRTNRLISENDCTDAIEWASKC